MEKYSNSNRVMEAGDHFKNGASPKSQTSRVNFLRKTLLFSLLCLFSVSNLLAQKGNPVSVKSGNLSVWKEKSTALFEIDYSAATADGLPVEEYLEIKKGDWHTNPKEQEQAAANFNSGIKKIKGMQVTKNPNAPYKIVVHVSSLKMGNAAGGILAGGLATKKVGGVMMSGTVDIIDTTSNEVVCVINVDEVKGMSDFSEKMRVIFVYYEIGKQIRNLVKKSK